MLSSLTRTFCRDYQGDSYSILNVAYVSQPALVSSFTSQSDSRVGLGVDLKYIFRRVGSFFSDMLFSERKL